LEKQKLVEIYKKMLEIRHFEERSAEIWSQGRIPGLIHLYPGMEAVATGACATLRPDDYVVSTHRGHGHAIAKGVSLGKTMAELLGKEAGSCKGKGGSMHIADMSLGVLGSVGIVGSGIPIATGVGLSVKMKGTDQVVACFFGDGATNTGAFHEGVNLASLWRLPVVFICENNLYGLSIPVSKATSARSISRRAIAYDMPGAVVDGMDPLAVHEATRKAVERARHGRGPTLLECRTYLFRGHMEGDPKGGMTYRTEKEMSAWKRRDPLITFKRTLLSKRVLTEKEAASISQDVLSRVDAAVKFAEESPYPPPTEATSDVFSSDQPPEERVSPEIEAGSRQLDLRGAINEALREEMRRDKRVFVMGEDVGIYGGIFKCTEGLLEEFGEERVRDTPISEAAILGAAVGAAATGFRPVAEIMFDDWIHLAMDGICNHLTKMRYMTGGQVNVPVVVRTACGARAPVASGGAQHSQCLESWFMHVPGLYVVTPSTPYDAKGLLKTAIRGNDPVVFFEHKLCYYGQVRKLYPTVVTSVPEGEYTIPFGLADIKRKGEDVTVVATMMMVHKSLVAAQKLAQEGISVEIIDPRTLIPFDKKTVIDSIKKTGKLVIAMEDCKTAGVGAEIAAMISEEAVDYLDAPLKRVAALDAPIPYSPALERYVVPDENKIIAGVREVTA
jgi:2-oxoisovalerate dehydrogenase E1 component